MKVAWMVALATAGFALGGGEGSYREATARGGFEIEGHTARLRAGGVGSITFEIEQDGRRTKGELLFAAEGHAAARFGLYPHVIVRVPAIRSATFTGNRVDIEADGTFHDRPVQVVAYAIDGASTSSADYFCIKAYDRGGDMVYHAMGHLTSGDIQIGGRK